MVKYLEDQEKRRARENLILSVV